ncbi:MAG: thiamine-phosphate kinase [Thermoanaerobaculia bacterium]
MAVRESEDRLLEWLRRRGGATTARLGDDAAFVELRGDTAWTVDQQIAGVHFPVGLEPEVVAARLLEVCLSDLAAVGAGPWMGLLALSAPGGFDHRRFFAGLLTSCERRNVELAGGDLTSGGVVHATLTVVGRRPGRQRWVRRDAARPGDRLWIAGAPGLSALGQRLVARGARFARRRVVLPDGVVPDGLERIAARCVRRHLQPEAQLELGLWLGGQRRAAAIDLSDGLSLDLTRLCRASECGAVLDPGALDLPAPARELARALGEEPLELALSGGEDYLLLAALPEGVEPPVSYRARSIGHVVSGGELWLDHGGSLRRLEPRGWDHLAAP